MDWLNDFHTITWAEAALRAFLACLFGFIIGYDRNRKNKPIDFRVFIIVAFSACLIAIMALELPYLFDGNTQIVQIDLSKVIEGVMVGTGFLGAGTIIKHTNGSVIGTATGASIWASAAFGLMMGFGLYSLSLLGFAGIILVLTLLGLLRRPLFDEAEKYETCPPPAAEKTGRG